jgi:hypothetical protein
MTNQISIPELILAKMKATLLSDIEILSVWREMAA